MNRPWFIWLVFGLCLALVLGAMGWSSLTVLELNDAQERAREQATLEENVRLALWRMDSALTPIIAQESMRPPFLYRPFYPQELALFCAEPAAPAGAGLVPSPLLTQLPPHVILHFQFDPEGRLSSPQVPQGRDQERAQEGCTTLESIHASARRLTELRSIVPWEALLTALGGEKPGPALARRPRQPRGQTFRQSAEAQVVLNDNEWAARAENRLAAEQQLLGNLVSPAICEPQEALLKPLWLQGASQAAPPAVQLVLARRITMDLQEHVQGCWLDWPGLKRWLLQSVHDLLPHADLEPVLADSSEGRSRMLASLPVRLSPGDVPAEAGSAPSPVRLSLVVAWGCVLVAAGAVAALLLGVVSLSERRGAFVSAVTHELRTPLTTFKMYSEMLARGMLSDEEKRQRYLGTLCREADRLTHLVENVLAFARLEKRGKDSQRAVEISVGDLLERAAGRLEERAAQAGLELRVEAGEGDLASVVRADPAAVEQILFNLVDNACKYASGPGRDVLRIAAERAGGGGALVRIEDEGPGIPPEQAKRLFRPFSKSARDAARSAPGVGLGLALSRRLARTMGGELTLDAASEPGACFVLRLPGA